MGEKEKHDSSGIRNDSLTNVLIFSHSSSLAGAERGLLELVKELIYDHDMHATVILPSRGPLEELLQKAGAVTVVAPIHWWCTGDVQQDNSHIRQLYSQSFEWIIENIPFLKQCKPDVVMTNTLVIPWGAVAASLLKCPHIWMVNEFGELDHRVNFFLPFAEVLSFIDQSSDKIITCSKAIQKALFAKLGNDRIDTIYYYIDVTENESIEAPGSNYFLMPDACNLLISGTVTKSKGQEDAVRAVIELVKNRHRQVELVMAGYVQPDFQKYLREIIDAENVGDYIHIVQFQENIFPLIQEADIVLVCSRMEGFGRVTLEAMLMEKAVIATNTGGTMEMIFPGETGLLYTPGKFIQLADQIEKLLDEPVLRQELARSAYRFARKNFTKRAYGGKHHNVIMYLKNKEYINKDGISWFLMHQYQILLDQKSAAVAEHERQIASLNQTVAARDGQIAGLHQVVALRDNQIVTLNQALAVRDAAVAERDGQIASINQAVSELNDETVRRGEWALGLDQQLKEAQTKITQITSSNSWKITLPLREMRRWIATPRQQAKRYTKAILSLVKRIYQSLPLSYQTKATHRNLIAKFSPKMLLASGSPAATIRLPASKHIVPQREACLTGRSLVIMRLLGVSRRLIEFLFLNWHLANNIYTVSCSEIRRYGIIGFLRRSPYYLRKGKKYLNLLASRPLAINGQLFSAPPPTPRNIRLHPDLTIIDEQIDARISFVIPTLNGGAEFALLLRKIQTQRGLREIEIVIVDSGSCDNTVKIARAANCKVIEIAPAEFSHSYARNIGADAASGNYLLFMVQDAYPIGVYWTYGIIKYLIEYADNKLIAVSCAEYSRNDSGMMYDSMINTHYRFLGCLDYDRIGDYRGGDHMSLRAYGQLSDVSCLISKETFNKYRYRGDYAEDLDLGIRLIKDGYCVAMLASIKVIHSHNRPAYYYLKRSFVDVIFLVGMFDDFDYPHVKSLHGLLAGIVSIAAHLSEWMIGFSKTDSDKEMHEDIGDYICAWRRNFGRPRLGEHSLLGDTSLDAYIDSLAIRYLPQTNETLDSNMRKEAQRFRDVFLSRLEHFNAFAKDVYGHQDAVLREELRNVVIKTFCAAAGSALGFMCLDFSLFEGSERHIAKTVYDELKEGI